MPSELDNFLRQQDEQKKKKEKEGTLAYYESRQKAGAFKDAFRLALSSIIHPAMVNILTRLRRRDYSAKVLHEKLLPPPPYPYEKYFIAIPGTGKHFIFSVIGNCDLQKVCIDIEYMEHFYENGVNKPKHLKKTEAQYDIAQLTPELPESLVINAIKEIMPITLE